MTKIPKSLPYYKLYPSDFVSKTGRLTDEQVGAYIRLLNEQWLAGDIPRVIVGDGTGALQMICESAERSWPAISKYFKQSGDGMKNPRLEEERIKAVDLYNKKVKAGSVKRAGAIAGDTTGEPRPADIAYNSELITKKKENSERIKRLFAEFYSAYPRKVSKESARKALLKINPDNDLFAIIMTALEAQKKAWTVPQYIPHPSTWLNKKRWEDETIVMGKSTVNVYKNPGEDQYKEL